jgi:hypothetical protein
VLKTHAATYLPKWIIKVVQREKRKTLHIQSVIDLLQPTPTALSKKTLLMRERHAVRVHACVFHCGVPESSPAIEFA